LIFFAKKEKQEVDIAMVLSGQTKQNQLSEINVKKKRNSLKSGVS
jgi:hypothetical protein